MFLAEAANRIFYEESAYPTVVLLDKLRGLIVEQIEDGSLGELRAFTKEGYQAYRLPLPSGEVQEDGSEKIMLSDFKSKWTPDLDEGTMSSNSENLEAYQTCLSLVDDLLSSLFQ